MFIPTFVYSSIPTFVFFHQVHVPNGNFLNLFNIGPVPIIYNSNSSYIKTLKSNSNFAANHPQQVQYNEQHVLVTYHNNIKVPYNLAKLD